MTAAGVGGAPRDRCARGCIARIQFEDAVSSLELGDAMRMRLSTPFREVTVQVPIL